MVVSGLDSFFLITLYRSRHTNRLLLYSTNCFKAITQHPRFELLSHSIYPNNIRQDNKPEQLRNKETGQKEKRLLIL